MFQKHRVTCTFWISCFCFSFVLLLSSCSHTALQQEEESIPAESKPAWIVGDPTPAKQDRKWVVAGVELKNTQFSVPVRINTAVEKWVDYFTGRGRKHFDLYLKRSKYFIPYITPILKERGAPQDLVYLAMIESGFHNHARSRARAVGPWQFIAPTGRRYGLRIDWWVDERRDIKKSTEAAIRYLKDLYQVFGTWELAAAGYNAGERKIMRAIRRYGTMDYWTLIRHRFLRPETRNYYPKLLAAAIVAKNREQFGFPPEEKLDEDASRILALESQDAQKGVVDEPSPIPQSRADLEQQREKQTVLALEEFKKDYEGSKLPARLLSLKGIDLDDVEGSFESKDFVRAVATPKVNKKGKLAAERLVHFEIESPADLLLVAKAAGLSYKTVKHLNPEILRWCTPPQTDHFVVKLPLDAKDRFLTTYNHPAYPREVKFRKYKVRRGDSLRRIARRFGIRIDPIKDLNGIRRNRDLTAGKYIRLPIPNHRRRSISAWDEYRQRYAIQVKPQVGKKTTRTAQVSR